MGSSTSRLGSRPSRPRPNRIANRSLLSSLVCGGSSSRAAHEMEDHPAECLVRYAENCDRGKNPVQNSTDVSSLISSAGAGSTFPNTEIGSSSQSDVPAGQGTYFEEGLRSLDTSNQGKCLSRSKELISHPVSAGCNHDESSRDNSTTASTSFKEQQSSHPVSVNSSANMDAVNGSADKNVSQACPVVMRPSSSSPQGIGNSRSDDMSVENHVAEVMAVHNTNADTDSVHVSDIPLPFPSRGNDSLREVPSGLGFLVSNREQSREDGSVVHVDVMSISSNFLSSSNADTSNRESRRNGRRLFWDAFSRRSSRRFIDSPTILFSTDETEDLGFHDRWLLGLSGDFLDDRSGADSGHRVNRTPNLSERRRHSRSEVWERLRGGLDDNAHRNTTCPTGIHPGGMCSCGSFLMTEESSARASISRIVMLAEALFEVLDEIHRQPVSLSLSMVSVPAPASVVDSFPLKSHTKVDKLKHGDDAEQCHICLAEYEEGDKIRVLPCHHEYHMSCVDKWLKEIHGVCPLCRGDVREGLNDCSVSNSGISSI
ncbi:putative transcription factor C2H2 family [Rosa chinensis]|uniref:Putative transcription factor C2H2 family n=1 Tax=Rosa chinensis TaxID=74649 RepID=A0A2P6RIG1_ROSCH|nr:uncharacterized protein LOC112187359 [Rosa chinensis]PRQ46224.1 putative transcription factor C2H2 family [Rosa chinensis]